MNAQNSISIIGCGWLGLPLAEKFIKKGFLVKGSTTTEAKLETMKNAGIEPFLLKLNPQIIGHDVDKLLASETLIINIPPKINFQKEDAHLEQIKYLLLLVQEAPIKNIIYISSTSVYPEGNRVFLESDVSLPEQAASPVLIKVENLLQAFCRDNARNLTILRFGGLMGYNRIPAKYFSGWKGLTTGDIQVNYLHQDDAIGVIEHVISESIWNETFNIVSPIHPTKKEVYSKNCEAFGFEMPEFTAPKEPEPYKLISVEKWQSKSNFVFKYENPLDYFYKID